MKKDKSAPLIYVRWFGIRFIMLIYDIIAVNFSYYIALLIRYYINHELLDKANVYLEAFKQFAPYYTVCCLIVFCCLRLYSGQWKYAGLNDLNRIICASAITAVIQVAGTLVFIRRMTITYYVLGAAIQFILIAASRFSYRILSAEKVKMMKGKGHAAINVMIAGIGETSRSVRKKIESSQDNAAHPVCIFAYHGNGNSGMMDGIPVVSGMEKIKDYIKKYHVDCVILADSIMPEKIRKQIKVICNEIDVGVQDFSGYFQNDGGTLTFRRLMEYTVGAVEIVMAGKSKTFASGEQALMTFTEKYDIKSVSAKESRLVIEINRHIAVLNNVDEAWVREFEQETGEPISFF